MIDREKIAVFLDRLSMAALYVLIFAIPLSKALIEITVTTACISWILKKLIKKEFRLRYSAVNKPILALIIISIFSVINSSHPALSIRGLFKILEYLALYLVVYETINSNKRFRIVILLTLISVSLAVIDGFVQYLSGSDLVRGYTLPQDKRIGASFGHANDFAGYLIIVIPLMLSQLFSQERVKIGGRIIIAILGIASVVSLVLTYSRAGWLSLLAAVVLLVILQGRRATLIFITSFLVAGFFLAKPIAHKLGGFFTSGLGSTWRSYVWKGSLELIKANPLFGNGLNTYHRLYQAYRIDAGIGSSSYAHNCYLQMFAETGILGIIAFCWVIVTLFYGYFRHLKKTGRILYPDTGLLCGLFACLVHSFFDTNLYALRLATMFWFMAGLFSVRLFKDYDCKKT